MAPNFRSVVASDVHEDLVLMWQDALAGVEFPGRVTEDDYYEVKASEPSGLRGFVGFGCSFGGKWFGGYARESGSTAETFPRRAGNHLQKTISALPADATFALCSYSDHSPGSGTVVYADPPYATRGVGYKDSSGFDHQEFWETMDSWVDAGAHVFVSEFHAPDHWEPLVVSSQRLTLSSNSPQTLRKQGVQLDTLWAPKDRSYNSGRGTRIMKLQYVKVDLGGRAYTYSWDGFPLAPGDLVTVPGNSVRPEPSEAVVIRLLDRPDYEPSKIAALIRDDFEDLL